MERTTKIFSNETISKAVSASDFTTYSVIATEDHADSRGKARSAIRSFIRYLSDIYEFEEDTIFEAAKRLDGCHFSSDNDHGEAAIREFIKCLERNNTSLPEYLL